MEKHFIAYYRVSTQKQGISGLGLEAQQAEVKRFANNNKLIAEYTEVESGKKDKRPQLLAALEQCAKTGATLLIAKLDRLSRNVSFIEALKERGVKFICCDMPEANELVIGIMAQLAQFEQRMISERTKAALKAKKAQGFKLGGSSKEHCDHMRLQRKPVEYNETVTYIIQKEQESGKTLEQVANELNKRGFKTRRDKPFTPTAVFRISKHFVLQSNNTPELLCASQ
jgi:DNA invertase Pin-like site-specific DNA recombinase